jgi:hypothetical protein
MSNVAIFIQLQSLKKVIYTLGVMEIKADWDRATMNLRDAI